MEQIAERKTAVIIVLYNPSADDILNVRNIAKRYRGVIVDNSENPFTPYDKIEKMHYVCNRANKGIAEAQNTGISMMMQEDTDYFVFFDQDSRTEDDYPSRIVQAFVKTNAGTPNLAMLGPTVKRNDSGEEYKSAIHKDRYASSDFILRRDVISSGSFISADAIRTVGMNDERLFIDFVDYDWCWRAASKGMVCGITPNVSIAHKVGQREIRIGRQVVIISKPFRYFYQYRNYLWLLRRKYVPLQWKIATGIKFSMRLIYFPLFVKGGFECWKNMIKGIAKGL